MDKIVVLDFGGQYCHLISRRIRDAGIFAEVVPSDISAAKIQKDPDIKGLILSGGARSVYDKNAPRFDKKILRLRNPILGICYGHQLIAHLLGGKVVSGRAGEYGPTEMKITKPVGVLARLPKVQKVWMNHQDVVVGLPPGFMSLAHTDFSKIAAYANLNKKIFGVQFHPEVTHSDYGQKILEIFVRNVCNAKRSWTALSLIKNLTQEAKDTLGNDKAIIGLSGGIDSATAATLVGRAIGKNLTAVYVDTGLMRHDDTTFVRKAFAHDRVKLKIIQAKHLFFKALKGVTSPERKRKIIGKLFVDVFYDAARKEKASFLIQGTIYSDRIESGITKYSSPIKSHHNVGGLPKNLKLKLYEPLRDLYKDEVRRLANELGVPREIVDRQIFPGPGFAIRIVGEVTPARAQIVREASRIVEEELRKTKYWPQIWMSFAVLLPVKSVGIQGDARSYKYPVVVRIVESKDAMTANFSKIPYRVLEKLSTRITNEVKEVNRVVYDVTNKPPGTMEWE